MSWWLSSPRTRRCCHGSAWPPGRRQWWRSACREQGSAALVAVAMIAVLITLTVAGLYVGSAAIARHRAQAAADLAAVAAAARLAHGAAAACAHAAAVAQKTQTSATGCAVDELDVVVTVEAAVTLGRFALGPARAIARAGPVSVP
ncbi:Rv3654c family TadE-like protein [Mycolicibacterium sp. XJ1819]